MNAYVQSILEGIQRVGELLESEDRDSVREETTRFLTETDEKVWDLIDFLEGENNL